MRLCFSQTCLNKDIVARFFGHLSGTSTFEVNDSTGHSMSVFTQNHLKPNIWVVKLKTYVPPKSPTVQILGNTRILTHSEGRRNNVRDDLADEVSDAYRYHRGDDLRMSLQWFTLLKSLLELLAWDSH